MSETCRLRRGEGYEARSDARQEKGWGSQAPPAGHNRPQCGRFKGRERAFLLPAKWVRWGHEPLKAPAYKENKGVPAQNKEVTHMVRDKQKFALWLTPETKQKIEGHYRGDNCKSQSEFIEKAVKFYCGYLDTEGADDYLPRVLAGVLDGKLGALGDRMGRLLFKLAVDDAVMANVVAATSDVDLDTLKRLRARCVREVKETNGQFSFEDALKFQKGLE